MQRIRINRPLLVSTVLVGAISMAAMAQTGAEQNRRTIRIESIVPDSFITGYVRGFSQEETAKYKVLVYVKTDKWYIHPYMQGGEGMSFAKINPDGSWKIRTVRREFAADLVAAIVVPIAHQSTSPLTELGQLQKLTGAYFIEEGRQRL